MHNEKKITTRRRLLGALLAASVHLFTFDQVDAHDLRGVSWGDSSEAVLASEKTLTFNNKQQGTDDDIFSLSSVEHELIGSEKAKIGYTFFKNRLVSVYYEFELGGARNPFTQDFSLLIKLQEKYGEGKTEVFGLQGVKRTTHSCVDDFLCQRTTTWELPRTSIILTARVFRDPDNKKEALTKETSTLGLSYCAKNADQVEINRRGEESAKKTADEQKDEQKKDKQKL